MLHFMFGLWLLLQDFWGRKKPHTQKQNQAHKNKAAQLGVVIKLLQKKLKDIHDLNSLSHRYDPPTFDQHPSFARVRQPCNQPIQLLTNYAKECYKVHITHASQRPHLPPTYGQRLPPACEPALLPHQLCSHATNEHTLCDTYPMHIP